MISIPANSKNLFFEEIRNELKRELPGEKYQLKMSPTIRDKNQIEASTIKNQGSILILLYPKNNTIGTVLMKRPKYNGVHSNQISFPGGKIEKDDPDLLHTALRETKEELGINPQKISILGKLTPIHIHVSNIDVLPVIGKIDTAPQFNVNKSEVQYLIEVSLIDFFVKANLDEKPMEINNKNIIVPFYNINNEHIWGATAMIISEFIEVVRRIN